MEKNQNDVPDVVEKSTVIDISKYKTGSSKSKINLVEAELLDTLLYINEQIDDAEKKSLQIAKFSKSVIEGKKMLVEQKLNLLKQLGSIPEQRIKLDKLESNDGDDIADITSLFAKK
jgi:flagellar biosynthesis/type III secretory pathway chaperone